MPDRHANSKSEKDGGNPKGSRKAKAKQSSRCKHFRNQARTRADAGACKIEHAARLRRRHARRQKCGRNRNRPLRRPCPVDGKRHLLLFPSGASICIGISCSPTWRFCSYGLAHGSPSIPSFANFSKRLPIQRKKKRQKTPLDAKSK